jgi:hypothetical protein
MQSVCFPVRSQRKGNLFPETASTSLPLKRGRSIFPEVETGVYIVIR